MSVTNFRLDALSIFNNITNHYTWLLDSVNGASTHISRLLSEWEVASAQTLTERNPFLDSADKLSKWNRLYDSQDYDSSQLLQDYKEFCLSAKIPFDEAFWKKGISKSPNSESYDTESKTKDKLLLNQWQKNIDKASTAWEIELITQMRAIFIHELEQWLEELTTTSKSISKLGLDPSLWLDLSSLSIKYDDSTNGYLFDYSQGDVTHRDIKEFQRWSEYLANDEGVNSICELLGKMRQIESSERIEIIKELIQVETKIKDTSSREEIIGIRLGKEIEHALPSELALLSDPDTSILFDLKYLESRLLCFEMQGYSLSYNEKEVEQESTVSDEEKLGPMILCIDTSSSMSGAPETVAKAVALFIATQAKKQSRPCYLINFSTGITTLDLTGSGSLQSLTQFLGMSFHGGTDVAPALNHAMDKLAENEYKKADILIISDFIMNSLPSKLLESIKQQRKNGNKFNSLVVGDEFMTERMRTYFDHEWVFDPQTSMVRELIQFKDSITRH